jgi:hypothetical protein
MIQDLDEEVKRRMVQLPSKVDHAVKPLAKNAIPEKRPGELNRRTCVWNSIVHSALI